MSQHGVQYVIQQLISNDSFRERFLRDREATMRSVDVSSEEMQALKVLDVEALRRLTSELASIMPPIATQARVASIGCLYL